MVRTALALSVLIVTGAAFAADEKEKDKVKKPIGTWVHENGDNKVTFVIKDKTLTATLHTGNGDLVIQTTYEVDKDSVLKSKITKIDKNDVGAQVEEGHTFTFKFKIADGIMSVSDLKDKDGNDPGEGPKSLVEGDYKKEKDKKEEKKDK